MRAIFTCLAALATCLQAAAQWSLTPSAGLESTHSYINYNDQQTLSPLGTKLNPQISLRLNYTFNKTHSPYLGIATNRSITTLQFSNPETGATHYTASAGPQQLRLEAGYSYRSRPISLHARADIKSNRNNSSTTTAAKQSCTKGGARSSCGNKFRSHEKRLEKNRSWTMRIQPSAGIAYNPAGKSNLVHENGTNYQYNAGNWKAALTAGTAFEFARGRDRLFTVGFQYLKGLGNSPASITTQTGTKATTTYLSSRSSAWNITLGVPFTLSKPQRHGYRYRDNLAPRDKKSLYYRPCRGA